MSFFGELESLQFGVTSLSFHSGFKKFPRISTWILVSLATQISSTILGDSPENLRDFARWVSGHNIFNINNSIWLGPVAPLAIVWGYNDDLWQLNFQYQCLNIFNIYGSIQDLGGIVMSIISLRLERIFTIHGYRLLLDYWIWLPYYDVEKCHFSIKSIILKLNQHYLKLLIPAFSIVNTAHLHTPIHNHIWTPKKQVLHWNKFNSELCIHVAR